MQVENTVGFELKQMGTLVTQNMERHLKNSSIENLSATQIWVLNYLNENRNKEVFQIDIQNAFSFKKATVSEVIKRMQYKRLVDLVPSATKDRRFKQIVLTDKSNSYVENIDKFVQNSEEKFYQALSDEEITQFKKMAGKIINFLGED